MGSFRRNIWGPLICDLVHDRYPKLFPQSVLGKFALRSPNPFTIRSLTGGFVSQCAYFEWVLSGSAAVAVLSDSDSARLLLSCLFVAAGFSLRNCALDVERF